MIELENDDEEINYTDYGKKANDEPTKINKIKDKLRKPELEQYETKLKTRENK